MQKLFLILGTVLAGLSVVLGAMGAHGLERIADAKTMEIYKTGVQYQMYHALALLFLGLMTGRMAGSLVNYSGFFFIAGVVFFSGSLYLIASLKTMNKVVPPLVGIMTPIGGVFFILGWVLLLVSFLRK